MYKWKENIKADEIFWSIAEIKTLDWMVYTLYSDNEIRVAEIAEAKLNLYGKISNPVSEKSINLQMSEIPNRLSSGLIIF